jgi:hypothetical protein
MQLERICNNITSSLEMVYVYGFGFGSAFGHWQRENWFDERVVVSRPAGRAALPLRAAASGLGPLCSVARAPASAASLNAHHDLPASLSAAAAAAAAAAIQGALSRDSTARSDQDGPRAGR